MSSLTILLADISGSMGGSAAKSDEGKLFSRLDFVKQSALFTCNIIEPSTYFSIITFNNNSQVVLPPVKLGNNKSMVERTIMGMGSGGGTNISTGLQRCFEICNGFDKTNVILMSDGADSILNANNCEDNMRRIFGDETSINVDTIGFGPDANTQLLVKIATFTSGTYALCYDASMVGTIIGRAIARTYLGEEAFGVQVSNDTHYMFYNDIRMRLVSILLEQERFIDRNMSKLVTLTQEVKSYLEENENNVTTCYEYILNTYSDMVGELHMACSSQTYWNMWGQAYWTTMGIALDKQYAPNFKDISLQHFGTDKAKAMYEHFSERYNEMNMVEPSLARNYNVYDTSNISTQSFNNPDSVCFHMNSTMTSNTGLTIDINDVIRLLQLNEEVWVRGYSHGKDTNVRIETVIISRYDRCTFYKVNNCVLTANHPILFDNKWQHPKHVTSQVVNEDKPGTMFNIILAKQNDVRDQAIYIDNEACVCFGHGINDYSAATDPFWGTEKVIERYRKHFGNKPVIEATSKNIRSPETGFTIDLEFV
jgi:hypothetical protein